MHYKSNQPSITPDNLELPASIKLSPDNRWVIMAEYASNFSETMGTPAKPFRMALGALIIKKKLGTSDRETVEQIRENPYLQYFIGMSSYSNEAPVLVRACPASCSGFPRSGSPTGVVYTRMRWVQAPHSLVHRFEASMMVYFRERIEMNLVNKINQKMVKNFIEKEEGES